MKIVMVPTSRSLDGFTTMDSTVTTSEPCDIIMECGDAGIKCVVANINVTNHVSTDAENRNNRSTDLAL